MRTYLIDGADLCAYQALARQWANRNKGQGRDAYSRQARPLLTGLRTIAMLKKVLPTFRFPATVFLKEANPRKMAPTRRQVSGLHHHAGSVRRHGSACSC
jgi:hypothetical protein